MVITRDTEWAQKKCKPCEGSEQPITRQEARTFLHDLSDDWQLDDKCTVMYREYSMKDFSAAVDFIINISKIAEGQNHHPNLHLTDYRKLKVELSTHAIGGLSENDFIVAAKIDELPIELKT